jgi:hypothetical protein
MLAVEHAVYARRTIPPGMAPWSTALRWPVHWLALNCKTNLSQARREWW